MARLMIVVLFLAVLAGLAIGAASMAGSAMRGAKARVAQAELGNRTMQKLSFVLLVALILYVSVWGGA